MGALESGGCEPAVLVRGDYDSSGDIVISDAIAGLGVLKLGVSPPACMDAADFNDAGAIAISEAVSTRNWLFLGGPQPPSPGPLECGINTPKADGMGGAVSPDVCGP